MLLPMLSLLPHGKQSALALALPLLRNLLLAGKQSSLQLVLSPRPMPMYLPPLLSQPDIVSPVLATKGLFAREGCPVKIRTGGMPRIIVKKGREED